jgi:tetratricopeptide (TPR) repeat protein
LKNINSGEEIDMKCSAAKRKISDYVDGELDSKDKVLLEKHLEGCAECQKLRDDFRKIKLEAKGLMEYSPSGQAWFKIAAGIKSRDGKTKNTLALKPRRFVFSPSSLGWAVSAGLLLFIIVGAAVVVPKISGPAFGSTEYVISKLEKAERHYQKAIDALWAAVTAQKDNFNPQLYAVFQKNLTVIDQSISDCREAVLNNPNNLNSRNFLLAAYKDKRTLLEDMMAVETSPLMQGGTESVY